MDSIDKNDVDISVLFNWGNEFKVYTLDGKEIVVYIRLIGDADLNQARVYALRESTKLRKKLKNKNSPEREAFIADVSMVDKEILVDLLLAISLRDITTKALRQVNEEITIPQEPASDATLEEQEQYQEKVDNWPQRKSDLLTEKMASLSDAERKRLSKVAKLELYKEYEALMINRTCENTMNDAFKNATLFYATFKDPEYKQKLFPSIEDVANLPGPMRQQFIDHYDSLDLDMSDLKKLPEVMQ